MSGGITAAYSELTGTLAHQANTKPFHMLHLTPASINVPFLFTLCGVNQGKTDPGCEQCARYKAPSRVNTGTIL